MFKTMSHELYLPSCPSFSFVDPTGTQNFETKMKQATNVGTMLPVCIASCGLYADHLARVYHFNFQPVFSNSFAHGRFINIKITYVIIILKYHILHIFNISL